MKKSEADELLAKVCDAIPSKFIPLDLNNVELLEAIVSRINLTHTKIDFEMSPPRVFHYHVCSFSPDDICAKYCWPPVQPDHPTQSEIFEFWYKLIWVKMVMDAKLTMVSAERLINFEVAGVTTTSKTSISMIRPGDLVPSAFVTLEHKVNIVTLHK